MAVSSATTPAVWAQVTADSIESAATLPPAPPMTPAASPQVVPTAPAVAATYRNAYGAHLEFPPTCALILSVYGVLVVGGLLLISVIPVRFASSKLDPPFVLWFGSPKATTTLKPASKVAVSHANEANDGGAESGGCWWRLWSWLTSCISHSPSSPRNSDLRYRFHADLTQQLESEGGHKTYDSISVSADDDLAPSPRRRGGSKRASFFQSGPPSPPSPSRRRQTSNRLGSGASSARGDASPRRSPRAVSAGAESAVETKEDLVRAVERQTSMAIRAEKRLLLAQEDVSYETLRDDEIRTYEYLEFLRELLDGLAVKKICQRSGRVVTRTIFITPELTVVYWNAVGSKSWQTTKSSLQTVNIQEVRKGRHGSASATARASPERDALCVSIAHSDGKWLVLEAKDEAMHLRLFLGFSRLGQEKREQAAVAAAPGGGGLAEEQRDSEEKAPVPASLLSSGSGGFEEDEEKREEALSPRREGGGGQQRRDPEKSRE
ncbi:hypothetical protein BBJ28_00010992 [Nothophytophthora sp. Chile5]|nr:hypothetical protein BBJ28_00010992 [Nothophytophthora sp. Chile5]